MNGLMNAKSGQKCPDYFGEICQAKRMVGKIFEGEMLIRTFINLPINRKNHPRNFNA